MVASWWADLDNNDACRVIAISAERCSLASFSHAAAGAPKASGSTVSGIRRANTVNTTIVDSETEGNGKISSERRFYIASRRPMAKAFGQAARRHWAIENSLQRISRRHVQ